MEAWFHVNRNRKKRSWRAVQKSTCTSDLILLSLRLLCSFFFFLSSSLLRLAEKSRQVISLQQALQFEKESTINRNKSLEQTLELLRGEVQSSRLLMKNQEAKLNQLAVENDALHTTVIKLQEEKSNEQNELNVVKQELLRANAAKKLIEEASLLSGVGRMIAPAEVDMSDMNSLIDHVAWTKNVQVVIPNERKRTIRGHRGPVNSVRYNTAGTLLASGGTDGLVKIYDARTGANRASLRGTKESVMNVVFSASDEFLLASGNDSISRMWSLKSSRVIHTFVGHQAKVWAQAFTSDSNQIITGSHDRTLKIWSVERKKKKSKGASKRKSNSGRMRNRKNLI